ncbi:MAG: [FeFe] hydrogenase H-cluster maturation GTPase HydF [Oscillospiraceae bacterium]|nr:[FeFe] hydrogenase H-cluster maturation GTPase HydF [Oscillospiraceae bacterium]
MRGTPRSERTHIGFFGRANTGKSSLINALANQDVSIVSSLPGTTTDPVVKAMEILPAGPVLLLDTAGFDDESDLGMQRVAKTRRVLDQSDIAVLVCEADLSPGRTERELLDQIKDKGITLIIALNKADLGQGGYDNWHKIASQCSAELILTDAVNKTGVEKLKELLARATPTENSPYLVCDLIPSGSLCVLIVPIDAAAPKGRLILPQQQVIRDLIENGSGALVVNETEYCQMMKKLKKPPALVIADSQAFGFAARNTPDEVPLTSFSILFARYKGELDFLAKGVRTVEALEQGDKLLICEGCTHHRQCDDIGSVKIPRWLEAHTGKSFEYSFTSGTGFPDDISGYKLIIHCGGCMLTRNEMTRRLELAENAGVPVVNYGILIAHMNGILNRALSPLGR